MEKPISYGTTYGDWGGPEAHIVPSQPFPELYSFDKNPRVTVFNARNAADITHLCRTPLFDQAVRPWHSYMLFRL